MYQRTISKKIKELAKKYPVITIIGPRQSGKTTLSRNLFSKFSYVSLEDPDIRSRAIEDPRGLLRTHQGSVIFDEIQRVPELTSYLQTIVDDEKNKRQFILTGSHSGLLMEAVSQSLAGRTAVFELLPLSAEEIFQKKNPGINEILFNGGYPRIYDKELSPTRWYKEYFKLYVERDIRSILQIRNLASFEKFTHLVAGRTGQLVNFNSLSNEVGVEQPTIKAWIDSLKTTYICFTLQPHFKNFHKRVVKTPKLYFYDTGLLCYLLKITDPAMLDTHPLRGAIFENFVVSEYQKKYFNQGLEPPLYFWRDQKGHEVDLVIDQSVRLFPVEIKFSETFSPGFTKNIDYINKLQSENGASGQRKSGALSKKSGRIVYSGTESFDFNTIEVTNWKKI